MNKKSVTFPKSLTTKHDVSPRSTDTKRGDRRSTKKSISSVVSRTTGNFDTLSTTTNAFQRKSRPSVVYGKERKSKSVSFYSTPSQTLLETRETLENVTRPRFSLRKPRNQLNLTEDELSKEITKKLTQINIKIPDNLVVFSFKEGGFIKYQPESQIVTLYHLQGTALQIDSEEAKAKIKWSTEEDNFQNAVDSEIVEAIKKLKETEEPEELQDDENEKEENDEDEASKMGYEEKDEEEEEQEIEYDDEETKEGEVKESSLDTVSFDQQEEVQQPPKIELTKKRRLINQFNFCERAVLTTRNPSRSVETQTAPPPRSSFGANTLQWVIYDAYAEDYKSQKHDQEKEIRIIDEDNSSYYTTEEKEEINRKYVETWKILERMINQNAYQEILYDYRYYESPADEYCEGTGTFLPLWTFSYEKTKKLSVTDICFNTLYHDYFAVTYGSFDFLKRTEGSLCLFTIKNPSYPDFSVMFETSAMCCSFHPKYPNLLAVGLYNGGVAVFDLQKKSKKPIYESMELNCHSDCVWEIKWGADMIDGEINFFSISSDGCVFNWSLMQDKLSITPIIKLLFDYKPTTGPDGIELKIPNSGTCMTFHPEQPDIFLIGTAEGLIYKCNTAFSSKYLMRYEAHNSLIYRIDYNKYNSNIFISCSADWKVKIWEDMKPDPLFLFDLGSSVGDVKWSPYSTTVFAAVTDSGECYVYDLQSNKYYPICTQRIVRKRQNKLTRLTFNQKIPYILVGDAKGTVISLKLSPNLRLQVKPPKKQQQEQTVDQSTLQIQKLDEILLLAREISDDDEIDESITTTSN